MTYVFMMFRIMQRCFFFSDYFILSLLLSVLWLITGISTSTSNY